MKKKYIRQLCETNPQFRGNINLVDVNKCPKRFRTHDPRFASFILLPLMTKTLRNANNDLLIISLCHEPICGDTTGLTSITSYSVNKLQCIDLK